MVLLGFVSAIALPESALAQLPNAGTSDGQRASQTLVTSPVTIDQSNTPKQNSTKLNSSQLNNIADSIRVRPAKQTPESSVIPGNLIPKDLIRTPSRPNSDTNPLEVFQPPNPSRGLGINLNQF